jgi:hypothetical protein
LVVSTQRAAPPAGAAPLHEPRLPHFAYLLLLTVTLAAGAYLARRNLRAGRVDRSGAARVALWVFACDALARIIAGRHPLVVEDEAAFLAALAGAALFLAAEVWLAYAALEPYVRRKWPETMVSWTRLLRGRFDDALVGRDLLLGALGGMVMRLLAQLRSLSEPTIESPLAGVFTALARSVFYALFALFLLVLLRMALRRRWIADAAWVAATTAAWSRWSKPLLDVPIVAAQMLVVLGALRGFGLLAAAAVIFTHLLATFLPVAVAAPLIVALFVYGFLAAQRV